MLSSSVRQKPLSAFGPSDSELGRCAEMPVIWSQTVAVQSSLISTLRERTPSGACVLKTKTGKSSQQPSSSSLNLANRPCPTPAIVRARNRAETHLRFAQAIGDRAQRVRDPSDILRSSESHPTLVLRSVDRDGRRAATPCFDSFFFAISLAFSPSKQSIRRPIAARAEVFPAKSTQMPRVKCDQTASVHRPESANSQPNAKKS